MAWNHIQKKSSSEAAKDRNFLGFMLDIYFGKSAFVLLRVFSEHTSSLEWQFSSKCLSKSWLNNYWRCQTQLFLVAHSSHAHPLDLVSSYNSACSFDSLPPLSPLGLFKKGLISFALMDFQLWCKNFQDSHVSLHRHSQFLLHIYIFPSSSLWCARISNSVTSMPLLSASRPSVYSKFFVLFLPLLSRGQQMANSGQASTLPST